MAAGRVTLDGRRLDSPATLVAPGQRLAVDGKPLPEPEASRLFRFHKPRGLLTTARDPQGRPTIYEGFPAELPRLMPIGRLDMNSEGLLLLTNDGALKRRLELPATGWVRRYRVRVFGRVEEAVLAQLADGLVVEGVAYGPIRARLDSQRGDNAWLTMALTEGKNREIRRVCEHLGYRVNRLIRLAYGPFQLGGLPRGALEEVPARMLAEQLGSTAGGVRTPAKRKVGTAKAKPPKPRPGHRKAAAARKASGRKPAARGKGAGDADRRR
ncbi:pseudouridine synthase [Tistlia consotensis]